MFSLISTEASLLKWCFTKAFKSFTKLHGWLSSFTAKVWEITAGGVFWKWRETVGMQQPKKEYNSWSRPRRAHDSVLSSRLRPGNDFTGRCRGFGSVTDPQRWSWEAVVKVYTVTRGRCRAANIRSVGRNVLSRHRAEPEALATRLSFRITPMDSKLFLGLCPGLFFDDSDVPVESHVVPIPEHVSPPLLAILVLNAATKLENGLLDESYQFIFPALVY